MSYERRSTGVVVVEFAYQYTDRNGSIISIKPNEEYLLLEKTSDEWWLVCKDERTEPFNVPPRCVRELPSRFPLDPAHPPRPETTRVPEPRQQHKTPQRAVAKTSLSGEHDMDTKARSPIQQRPASPVPSCVSMKSDKSMEAPIMFSDGGGPSTEKGMSQQRPASPVPSCVSMKSDWSMNQPIVFSDGGGPSNGKGDQQEESESDQSHHEDLSSIFTVLEETVIKFVKEELKRMKRILSSDFSEGLESQREDQEVVDPEYQKQESSAREGALKITLHVLRNMNQKELADTLEKNKRAEICRQKLKSELRKKFETVFEGIVEQGNPTLLNKIYTDLYITEGESGEINKEHEVRQIEIASRKSARTETAITCNNIFKPSAGRDTHIRIVLTKGVAGIGKTVSVQKFITDWAEGLANQEIQFIFPFPFRELNLLDGEEFSLMELVHHFFSETRESGISNYDKYNVLFVFDGLDECRLPLAFKKNKSWCDVTESTSVDVLLTNLIRGKLLPSALIWITTRPAAANQIPSETVIRFVKEELKRMKRILSSDFPEGLESQRKDQEVVDPEYQKQESSAREGALKITLLILRNMNQKELADTLEKNERPEICRQKLRSELRKKFETVFEGIAKQGNPTLLNKIYTDLYITEGESGEVNKEHELSQIETASRKSARTETAITCNNIFKPSAGRDTPIRIVLTKGVAGIGKTVSVQKFITDWAEGLANQEIQFIFPLPFRELNLLDGEEFSLTELVHHFFSETRESGIFNYNKYNVLFVFDGLDECRLPLAFKKNKSWCDVTESTSVDVLLTNLIRGNLLPSALIWITTRPAAANQIPSECVDLVTEVRGFNDPQKDEYIMKRCSDEILAGRIISHIKTSRILYIMCHIPVFSWITVTVLEHMLRTEKKEKMPKTLTEMYTTFLVLQTKQKKVKYAGKTGTDPHWNEESIQSILSLGKLAFHQLEKGNLIFYEKDLTECGIDVCDASVYSGVFTQIFRQEGKVFQEKVFCFVHLSFQEFLAAVFVFLSFINNDENLMSKNPLASSSNKLLALFRERPEVSFYKSAVNRALQSKNGQLDLFLRFLLGLSMESNQTDLRGLLTQTRSNTQSHEETVKYIKEKIREDPTPERCMNLFHCLNELNDHSLVEEIQHYLSSGSLSSEKKLSSTQWSALVFVLLTSEEKMDVFDLKIYSRSEEGFLRLLPVVKDSKTALLNDCNLSERCCEALASALPSSDLTELDLSNNNLGDSGMKLLSAGLGNPLCKLETLRLSSCLVTEEGCASLASALRSNPFHLRELDLSYNHPGEKGLKLLSAGLEDPHCRLEKLNVDHGGECWIKPGFLKAWKYACELTLDPNTAHRELSLSEENRKVTWRREEQPYPDHPERFENWTQVLCREGLSGRCYWEAEWSGGGVHIAVTYKGISRRGEGADCVLGLNKKSWSLECGGNSYSAWHNNKSTDIPVPPSSPHRVGVYLDWPAGTLSFYTVSSDTLTHLHTFHRTFTEPLYPGFWVYPDSSVSLGQVE
ncbi:uncharacterized protein LOC124484962 [Hypomesus transpacificus]|uniref:uncharacterized protein LOC124484962 n=1 Tax=Hypomesus transpacificus TaxID=137520 RepID=UPI001F07EC9D|nr:uncharacterized protein LOC124484962 [Hypomesus transpacificus]